MNKKKVLFFSFVAFLSGNTLMAQTGQWKLTGNSLNGTQKLGVPTIFRSTLLPTMLIACRLPIRVT
jgi:hypothetical protein